MRHIKALFLLGKFEQAIEQDIFPVDIDVPDRLLGRLAVKLQKVFIDPVNEIYNSYEYEWIDPDTRQEYIEAELSILTTREKLGTI